VVLRVQQPKGGGRAAKKTTYGRRKREKNTITPIQGIGKRREKTSATPRKGGKSDRCDVEKGWSLVGGAAEKKSKKKLPRIGRKERKPTRLSKKGGGFFLPNRQGERGEKLKNSQRKGRGLTPPKARYAGKTQKGEKGDDEKKGGVNLPPRKEEKREDRGWCVWGRKHHPKKRKKGEDLCPPGKKNGECSSKTGELIKGEKKKGASLPERKKTQFLNQLLQGQNGREKRSWKGKEQSATQGTFVRQARKKGTTIASGEKKERGGGMDTVFLKRGREE